MENRNLIVSIILYALLLSMLFYLIYPRVAITEWLLIIVASLFAMAFVVYSVGVILLLSGGALNSLFLYYVYHYYVFPIAGALTSLFCRDKLYQWEAFITMNNRILEKRKFLLTKDDVLVLLPHCLQNTRCGIRITNDLSQCKECGQCEIGALKKSVLSRGMKGYVVTGSTLAKKVIKEHMPKAILAVACHHDLFEGIKGVYPIPVYGVLNTHPEGPCVNTHVNTDALEYAITKVFGIH